MSVAQILRTEIKGRGISYSFISRRTGIPVDTLCKSMRGVRRLTADELVTICKVLNITSLDNLHETETGCPNDAQV